MFFFLKRTGNWFITLVLITVVSVIGASGLKAESRVATVPDQFFYVAPHGSDRNEGSIAHPWGTIHHAAQVLKAGETVYLRAGVYSLTQQIQTKNSGTENAWITYAAFPGERVILDAKAIQVAPASGHPPFAHDQGAFQLENVAYIRVKTLEISNSHNSGFTVRNSHHIELYNNQTTNTFSPGIGVWNSQFQKVMGNTVINANAREMADFPFDASETPHEAISLGSVENFEIAYNLVRNGQKEGIDIKGASKHGTVHHNYVHHMPRQALYVDSWDGTLEDVEVAHNVAHDCRGAGLALSVEGGTAAKDIRVHHNLLYDNLGTGIFFSRWGNDGLRENIKIYNNTVHHNGYGRPNPGESFYWITGGLYLFSDHLQAIEIKDNIFSKNAGFQIGYSDRYLKQNNNIDQVFQQKQIEITHNLIFGTNSTQYPIYAGWEPDNYANISATYGTAFITGNPQFINPAQGNFYLENHSPAIEPSQPNTMSNSSPSSIGAFPFGSKPDLWWQANFPPPLAN